MILNKCENSELFILVGYLVRAGVGTEDFVFL